jgi:hypothetical protein
MQAGWKAGMMIALLAQGIAFTISAQVAGPGARSAILSSGDASGSANNPSTIFREIDDPHLGTRWLLMHDPNHPGGPGRLGMVSQPRPTPNPRQLGGPVSEAIASALQPVIHAGDRVIVEESSPIVEARLEAVALGPARAGSILAARLRIGGLVVRAVALGPGRVALQPENGVRP